MDVPRAPSRTTGTRLRVLSATYGPAEGRRLLDGKLVDYTSKETYVPYTRDVLPFLRALAGLSGEEEGEEGLGGGDAGGDDLLDQLDGIDDGIISGLLGEVPQDGSGGGGLQLQRSFGKTKHAFALMDGRPMNAVFGDPCPGTTKLLRVEYLFQDFTFIASEANSPGGERIRQIHCTTSRVFKSTFREHERVVLKRQDPLLRLLTDALGEDQQEDMHEDQQRDMLGDMKPADGLCEHDGGIDDAPGMVQATPQSSSSSLSHTQQLQPSAPSSPSKKRWNLAPSTSEITLPIILPYLTVRQRAQCQMVCSSWREIVLERGVAMVVDVNDVGLFPKDRMDFGPKPISRPTSRTSLRITDFVGNGSSAPSSASAVQNHPSRVLLRGLLTHSYSSLESLVLNDYLPLQPDVDLHPALPHLRKLRRLDISRIPSIRDETLHLVSTCIRGLEVLYMKGLKNVTNEGVIQVVRSCRNLRVLDVSNLSQLDDEAGIAISELEKLQVLNTKDNYKWTNRSVDLITRNCKQLFQASLWGIIRLNGICFEETDAAAADAPLGAEANENASMPRPMSLTSLPAPPLRLILLNLWGCHGLTDDAATQMSSLSNLRSLCVSECHKLTDRFVQGITQSLPQLVYLRLRYVRRITDASLEAIGHQMTGLYSLDVSFCNKLTVAGLCQLMAERCTSLAELRLYSCRQLNVEGGNSSGVVGGRQFVQALRNVREVGNLSFLDLRECQIHEPFVRDDVFLAGMAELGFDETLRGLFVRPACWNPDVRRQLRLQLRDAEV